MQFGSLRQLTLASFVLALVPLATLLVHSQNSLDDMADRAGHDVTFSLQMARSMAYLDTLSSDIERLVRQQNVLQKSEIEQLVNSYLVSFTNGLQPLCRSLHQPEVCIDLVERSEWFAQFQGSTERILLDAHIGEFKRALSELRKQVNLTLDKRLLEQQNYVQSVQSSQAWSTGILVSVSLLLVVLSSRLVVRPMLKLEKIIRAIANQSSNLPEPSSAGPKELLELEQQLFWLSERFTQLENLRQALLRHASHELKTPLASIKEGCALLSEQVVGELNEQQNEVLALLNRSAERLNLLVEQLLDYNLLLQQAKPVYKPVAAESLLQAFIADNTLAIQQNGNQVRLRVEVGEIYIDEHLYRRILDNLLSNALAHGVSGRPIDIHLYHKTHKHQPYLVLDVANRGRKIPEEMRDTLFQPFIRGEHQRKDRVIGSGLGLSIVADCARLMRGKAEIVDVPHADVCLRVSIPTKEKAND